MYTVPDADNLVYHHIARYICPVGVCVTLLFPAIADTGRNAKFPVCMQVIWHVLCSGTVQDMWHFLHTGNLPGHMACTVCRNCAGHVAFPTHRKVTSSYGMYYVQELCRTCGISCTQEIYQVIWHVLCAGTLQEM